MPHLPALTSFPTSDGKDNKWEKYCRIPLNSAPKHNQKMTPNKCTKQTLNTQKFTTMTAKTPKIDPKPPKKETVHNSKNIASCMMQSWKARKSLKTNGGGWADLHLAFRCKGAGRALIPHFFGKLGYVPGMGYQTCTSFIPLLFTPERV